MVHAKNAEWHNVKDAVSKVLKRIGIDPELELVFRAWDDVLGDLGKYVRFEEIREKKVIIARTEVPLAKQELLLRRNEIIREINKHLKKIVITDIVFTDVHGGKKVNVKKR
ncbi:MAG: DciA family protein [Elusimicrobiota bacterium]